MSRMRWTVRSVDYDLIQQVRALHEHTGNSLGEIVSASLRHGLAAARSELVARPPTILEQVQSLLKIA